MVVLLTFLISRCQFATCYNDHGILGPFHGVNVLDVFGLRGHFILFQAGSWLCVGLALPFPSFPETWTWHQVLKSEQKYTKLTGNVGGHYHSAAARSLRQEPDLGLDCDWMAVFLRNNFLDPRKMNGWNLRIHPWKRKIIFQTIIFRFYINLRGCTEVDLGEFQNGFAFPQIYQFQQEIRSKSIQFSPGKATLHSPPKTNECPLKRGCVQRERRKSSKVVGILPYTPFRQRHCCVVDGLTRDILLGGASASSSSGDPDALQAGVGVMCWAASSGS